MFSTVPQMPSGKITVIISFLGLTGYAQSINHELTQPYDFLIIRPKYNNYFIRILAYLSIIKFQYSPTMHSLRLLLLIFLLLQPLLS